MLERDDASRPSFPESPDNSTKVHLFSLAPASLQAMRAALIEHRSVDAIPLLQQAGYATGEAIFDALTDRLAEEGAPPPDQLPPEAFTLRVGAFLQANGWGRVTLGPDDSSGDPRALIVTVDEGPESADDGTSDDGCPLTTGVLSGLLTRVVDAPVAVMAIEAGDDGVARRCRFLAASPATVQAAWQAIAEGREWRDAVRR